MPTIVIEGEWEGDPEKLVKLLQSNRFLKRIGQTLVSQAKQAFEDQRFGGVEWPQRYPNQTGESLNVAGALSDLSKGPNVKARRYEPRPAGRDTGLLMRSITAQVAEGTISVGSNLPYAQRFHAGGTSSIPITSTLKHHLATFLRKKRRSRKAKKAARERGELGPRGGFTPMESRRLGPVFSLEVGDTWDTESPARPFVGITEQTGQDIAALVRELLEEKR